MNKEFENFVKNEADKESVARDVAYTDAVVSEEARVAFRHGVQLMIDHWGDDLKNLIKTTSKNKTEAKQRLKELGF